MTKGRNTLINYFEHKKKDYKIGSPEDFIFYFNFTTSYNISYAMQMEGRRKSVERLTKE
jgi:hypothetical protein